MVIWREAMRVAAAGAGGLQGHAHASRRSVPQTLSLAPPPASGARSSLDLRQSGADVRPSRSHGSTYREPKMQKGKKPPNERRALYLCFTSVPFSNDDNKSRLGCHIGYCGQQRKRKLQHAARTMPSASRANCTQQRTGALSFGHRGFLSRPCPRGSARGAVPVALS